MSVSELRQFCQIYNNLSRVSDLNQIKTTNIINLDLYIYDRNYSHLIVPDLIRGINNWMHTHWTFSSCRQLTVIYRYALSIHLSVVAGPCSSSVYLLPSVSNADLTSSSIFDNDYGPDSARLTASTGWAPDVLDDSNPWIQVSNTNAKSKR